MKTILLKLDDKIFYKMCAHKLKLAQNGDNLNWEEYFERLFKGRVKINTREVKNGKN